MLGASSVPLYLCASHTDSDCSVGSTLLPHTSPRDPIDLMISVVWAHFGSSESTSIIDLMFLLVYIVDIVLGVRHCALYAVEG